MNPMLIGALVGLGIMALGLVVAFARRGSAAGARLGSRRLDVHTSMPPEAAFERLRALGGRYRTDDADPSRGVLVLSSNPTFATWGFFYPVFVRAQGKGARIEIGIESRFIQFGPLVGAAHKRAAADIEAAVSLPVARAIS